MFIPLEGQGTRNIPGVDIQMSSMFIHFYGKKPLKLFDIDPENQALYFGNSDLEKAHRCFRFLLILLHFGQVRSRVMECEYQHHGINSDMAITRRTPIFHGESVTFTNKNNEDVTGT